MVSLRSERRLAQPSPASAPASELTETPKRRPNVNKQEPRIVDDAPTSETIPEPVEEENERGHNRIQGETGLRQDESDDERKFQLSPDVFADSDSEVPDSHGEESEGEEAAQTKHSVNSTESVGAIEDHVPARESEDSDDDDDAPMEVSSKKEKIPAEKSVIIGNSDHDDEEDDNEPMEITSKLDDQNPPESNNFMDKILAKQAEKDAKKAAKKAKLDAKKLKRRNLKKDSKKVAEGIYQVKMKKSKAKFNVVTLKKGVQSVLEPQINFREELLKSRTAGTRVSDTANFYERAKWVSKR